MDSNTIPLPEAARIADVPEEELRQAVRDGLLLATLMQNTGEWHVPAEELVRYIKRTRHVDPFKHQKKRKVLVLGEDLLFAGTLKLELQRDPRIDVRYASWGKDAILLVDHYNADLFVIDLTPSKVAPDEVLCAVQARRGTGKVGALAFFTPPAELLDQYPLVKSRLAQLAPEGFVSKQKGMRALTILCFSALGLETNTKVFKRQA